MVKKIYHYKLKSREGLIFQWDDGLGEIAPLPGFSKESLEEAKEELLLFVKENRPPTLPSVRFGIACAQKPLNSVHLPLCALGPKNGFSMKKLKLGHLSVLEAVELVKTQLPHALRLDWNRQWSLEEALAFTSHFKPNDFVYMEEPTENLIAFSETTKFPVAVDESIHTDYSKIPTLKAVVVKPTLVGYIPQIPSHLDLVLSSSYESGLGLLHIANLAQTHTTLPLGLDTVFENDLLIHPIRAENGVFSWEKKEPIIDFSKLSCVY